MAHKKATGPYPHYGSYIPYPEEPKKKQKKANKKKKASTTSKRKKKSPSTFNPQITDAGRQGRG